MKNLIQIVTALVLFLSMAMAHAEMVNINTADAATLAANIVGVGQKKAEAIVAFREKNGKFKSVDELTQVKGIGLKLVDTNRANLTVDGPAVAKKQ